jgi:DNA primase
MRDWLEESLSLCSLSPRAQDYLLGRGATQEVLEHWGLISWECPFSVCPEEEWREKYGKHFEALEGNLAIPLRSPQGVLLGVEFRSIDRKKISRLVLPEAKWNPLWIGMPQAMPFIWKGSPIYIVEGIFDLFAMRHIIKQGAILGSGPAHLNFQQLTFLRRWSRDIIYMVYDRDPAGRKGTEDAIQTLSKWGLESKEVSYGKPGDDPGVIWDRGGVEALKTEFPYL